MKDSILHGSNPDLPNYARPELLDVAKDLDLVRDLLGGTRRMHERADIYIRRWADEDPRVWDVRAKCEQVQEGLSRALSAGVGMLFARSPSMDWRGASEAFRAQWENIDSAGTHGRVFVKKFADMSLRDGTGLIVVDHPSPPKDEDGNRLPVTAQTEADLNLRPTWASYPRANILSWHTETVDNAETLTQVNLYEPTLVRKGRFGVELKKRYRTLFLVDRRAAWILWEAINENPAEQSHFRVVDSGYYTNRNGDFAPFLPVAVAHTGRSDAILCSTIPLLGVAWANLGHWQISTNLRFYTDLASFPQPTVIGSLAPSHNPVTNQLDPGKLRLGPLVVIQLMGENADFKWSAPPVETFEPLERQRAQKERDMATMSFSFLAKDKRVQETAEAKRLDSTAENASLATAAQGIDDCINQALYYHAWFLGEHEKELPVFELNRDFEATVMDPAAMLAYVTAVEKAGLPRRLLLEAWQEGGRIPADADLDELLLEMMAEAAAQEAARAEAAAEAAAVRRPGAEEEDPALAGAA